VEALDKKQNNILMIQSHNGFPLTGGSLICCDLCPTSFHAECLRMSPPEGSFICEDCDTGRFPLYGEIVWVKLGSYRSVENSVTHSCGNLGSCFYLMGR
jgi:hypothetical protein